MPIDASIPLQAQQVNPMQSLSSVLGMANQVQSYKNAQLANQQGQNTLQQSNIDLQERQGVQGVLKNIKNYQDSQGNIDYNKLTPDILSVAPTTGSQVISHVFAAQQQATQAKSSINELDAQTRQQAAALVYSLGNVDPATGAKMLEAAKAQYPGITPAIEFLGKNILAPAAQATVHGGDANAWKTATTTAARFFQPIEGQKPAYAAIPSESGTQLTNTNPLAPEAVGATAGAPIPAPRQILTTPQGTPAAYSPSRNTVAPLNPQAGGGQAAPTVSLPPGETPDTAKDLQGQRQEVQSQLRTLPERQNIYREIIGLTDQGTLTGTLGALKNKINSATGYQFSGSSDVNELGKFLEQEASRSAQAMGPHTNAGLESARAAGGTTQYDDKTIGKIARLNSANAAGLAEYNKGLESAIANQAAKNPGVDPIFVKRQFDQKWGDSYDPRITRLSNAMQSGDTKDIVDVFHSVGVEGGVKDGKFVPTSPMTKAANTLMFKIQSLKALSQGQF